MNPQKNWQLKLLALALAVFLWVVLRLGAPAEPEPRWSPYHPFRMGSH
ncbi:MAG TPA: hypothetical protein PK876_01145 [Elusimicrobiota bacterium]|nr:hypothetical protein [Elusimicrobiota bacterium]